jgi:hypothetical protein
MLEWRAGRAGMAVFALAQLMLTTTARASVGVLTTSTGESLNDREAGGVGSGYMPEFAEAGSAKNIHCLIHKTSSNIEHFSAIKHLRGYNDSLSDKIAVLTYVGLDGLIVWGLGAVCIWEPRAASMTQMKPLAHVSVAKSNPRKVIVLWTVDKSIVNRAENEMIRWSVTVVAFDNAVFDWVPLIKRRSRKNVRHTEPSAIRVDSRVFRFDDTPNDAASSDKGESCSYACQAIQTLRDTYLSLRQSELLNSGAKIYPFFFCVALPV